MFEPFHSSVDPEFWQVFEKKKLTEFKLDNSQKEIIGTIHAGGKYENISAKLKIGWESFDGKIKSQFLFFFEFFVSLIVILNSKFLVRICSLIKQKAKSKLQIQWKNSRITIYSKF